jgi:regulator of CtrA degradation
LQGDETDLYPYHSCNGFLTGQVRILAEGTNKGDPVRLGPRLTAGAGFDALYADGMGLVEEVASYLDGPGRAEAKALERVISVVYATESMRLTTRLMQMASWLLLQRAVREGELSAEEARSERHKVTFRRAPMRKRAAEFDKLPEDIKTLIARSEALYGRILKLDTMERGLPETGPDADLPVDGVGGQLKRLRAAYDGLK